MHVGPIAAGEAVVASRKSRIAAHLKRYYGDALAVEMEGRGFLQAAHIQSGCRAVVVRGISDLLAGKAGTDKLGWQKYAADAAATFFFEMLALEDVPDSPSAALETDERPLAVENRRAGFDLLEIIGRLEWAARELPDRDRILASIADKIQRLGFDFVIIQLINKGDRTIETVCGQGVNSQWFGIEKHTVQGDPELWDIHAYVAMHDPPRIEIIAGRDSRFDDYIFEKFRHEDHVRAFVPIILAPSEVMFESMRWDQLKGLPLNVGEPSRNEAAISG